jgi:hypothetical protein
LNAYLLFLFVHILGGIGIFVALAFERLGLRKLQTSTDRSHAREWIEVLKLLPKIGAPSALAALLSGIYLTAASWRKAPWISPAFCGLILLAVVGAALSGPAMKKLEAAWASEMGTLSARHPVWGRLWISVNLRTGLAAAILFLMVAKPSLVVSLTVLAIGIVLSLLPFLYFVFKFRALRGPRP